MECEFTFASNEFQDGPNEEAPFRRAVAFFKTFGSNAVRTHSPGWSRVSPNLGPSIPAYTRRFFHQHHLAVGRTQEIGHNATKLRRSEGIPQSRECVADLCDVLRAFGEEWIRRLALGTSVPQTLPEHYFCSLLGLGIRVLRNHFRGATPSSLQDMFALTHVAMASLYVVREVDEDCPWNLFGEEARQWQDLLSNVIEKGAFTKAMKRLCHPQTSATWSPFKEVSIDNSFLPAEQAMLVRLIDRLSRNRDHVVIEENGDHDRQNSTAENEQSSSSRRLQSNALIKECTGFLDGNVFLYMILKLIDLLTNGRFWPRCHC